MKVGGIILCGGHSSRMGRPKAGLPFGGETLLARVVRILTEVVQPIVVAAARGQDVPPLPGDVVIVRDEEKDQGPLQGLVAGLVALQGQVDAAYLSGCDVPFLQPAFVRRLIDLLGEHHVCVPRVEGHLQPLAAVYHLKVLVPAQRQLAAARRAPVDLVRDVPSRIVEATELRDIDPALQSLRNLNTLEEYQAALATLREGSV